MTHLLLLLIRIYQLTLSPLLVLLNGGQPICRHDPTCSRYAMQALREHGVIKGSWLALKRLLRCHPWGTSGHDPVPPQKQDAND